MCFLSSLQLCNYSKLQSVWIFPLTKSILLKTTERTAGFFSGLITEGISREDVCALLVKIWAAEQLGPTWPSLSAVGNVSVHFHSGYCAFLCICRVGNSLHGQAVP